MRKKFLLMLTVLVIALGGSGKLFAEGVAKVGNTEYATIDEAIANWTNGTTLTLLADVQLSDVIQLSSTEMHTLDLSTFTMTAASKKDAIQIVNNGRSSASYALDIKADATNPGGITATGKTVVVTTGKSGVKDRPIIRFYNGVFNATNIVKHSGSNGTNCPQFQFHGGVFNGNISTNRSLNQFYGGTFNGQLWMSVDSSAYTLIAGGTFKQLSNLYMSALNSDKFTIGSAKGVFDRGVYVDDNGNVVIGGAVVTEAGDKFEASSTNAKGAGNYLEYSSAKNNGLYYTSVKEAFADNNTTSGKVTVYAEEVDMTDISYKGTIVVPEGKDITITNAPSTLKVQLADGTVLTPDANGTVATKLEVATLDELQAALASNITIPIIITAQIEIPADETVVLDLNGKTVNSVFNGTSTTNHIYALSNKGTLTIEDSKDNGSTNSRGIYNYGSINSRGIYNYGSLTLNAGAINAIDGNGGYAVNNQSGSTFVMNGGVVAATNEDDHQSSSGGYDATALKVPAGCTATLNGGTINNVCDFTYAIDAAGTLNIPETSAITVNGTHGAIYVSGGETTINAGTFQIPADEYNRTDNVLYVSDGSLVVNGGTFIGDSDTASGGSCLYDAAGKAVVNGGTFKGSSGGDVWGTTGTTIKGGTFENLTEKQHIAAGYELNADGTVVKIVVAKIGETPYYTLADAIAAAQTGDEIVIIANVELTETTEFPAGKTITLNLNNKKVSAADKNVVKNSGAALTIKNGTIERTGTVAGYAVNVVSGTLEVENVTIVSGLYTSGTSLVATNTNISQASASRHAIYAYNCAVTINSGTYHNDNAGNAAVFAYGSSVVTINNGTFSINNGKQTLGWTSCLLDANAGGKYVINGGEFKGHFRVQANSTMEITGGTFENTHNEAYAIYGTAVVKGGTFTDAAAQTFAKNNIADDYKLGEDGKVVYAPVVAKIGETKYETLDAAFAAATEGQTITLLADATPALTSQRAITKAAVIDLGGKTLNLIEDDLYFGTTTFKNGTIVVDPSVKPSTAVFWMFANQTLTFDNVKVVATGVTGTYLIGLDGNNSDLNLLNGSEILVENTTALDLDIICVNASTGNDIKVENSKVNVTNLDGRVFFRGNYTVKDSEINLAGITKAGFRIEAGQTLSIEGTSKVNIAGEPRDGGIHLTDLSATYTKAETATVNATVNEPKVAKVGENTYRTLAQAVAAVEDGGTITLIANETFTKNNRYNNGGYWDGLGYSGDKSFTIDLAGFTISQDGALNDYLMWFKNDGAKANTITLMNGTLDAGTTAYSALATSSSNAQKITVNLENINVINNNSNGAALKIRGGSELNVKAGTIITGQNSYLGIEAVGKTTVVNIYEGAEIYQNGTSSYCGCLAGASGNSTINVYGGKGQSKSGGFIAMTSGGTINIEGGEWTANTDGTYANGNKSVLVAQSDKQYNAGAGNSIVNVTGGTFKGGYNCYGNAVGDAQINIKGGNFNAEPTSYVAEDYIAVENNGVWNVVKAAAKIGETPYATLEAAFKAATSGCVIDIINNVTVDYAWDCRNYGATGKCGQFSVPVTINGNGNTIKFTAEIKDNNWNTVFRFEENATVKNLTVDIANATGAQRVISAKKSLNVDGLTIVGTAKYGIIFGEGASATDLAATEIVVKNSTLNGTRRAISDNEGGKDVKSVVITGNTLKANAYISASESIVFNNNTANGEVDLRSYTAENVLSVEAKDNDLTEGVKNYIFAKTIDAQEEFETENPPLKVSNKAELDAALAAAKEGNTITLTADIDYGTTQLAITKVITLDLGGNTLTTRNPYGGMSVKGNPTIKNGTIVHASNTAAIKVWNATAFEDLVIDVQGKGDANKTIGGIVLQSGSTTRVGSIKNVTIKGAALTNGIETYNCGDATENVIGAMENVAINAQGTGMLISAPCGTATNCDIKGGVNGIEIWIKGNYSASLDLVASKVEGGVYAHDEFNSNPGVVNNGTLNLTADDATTGAGVEDVTLTIARAENLEGVIEDVMEAAQAKIDDTYYTTIAKAISAAQAGQTVTILAGTYPVPAVKAGITIEGQGNVLLEGTLSNTLENLTMKNIHIKGGNAQRWAYAKGNLLFENVTFEATSVYALHFDGIAAGTNLTYKNCTIIGWAAMGGSPASCIFEGCTIKGNGTYGVIRTYFDATIQNCTFDVANVNTNDIYEDGIHAVSGAEVTVTNCTNANGDMKNVVNVGDTSVVVLNGVEIKNVAKIGDKYYLTLQEAFAAVGNGAGKTVELIRDVDLASAEWTPVDFNGVFDGQNHTISNLVVNGGSNSNQGFFGTTQNGEIKNVTFDNAKVTGRLNVGVVAGTPYTSKYTNVKVTGHVEVNGMAYVGGVGGKNAYANWTDITVDVDATSYVEANSVENGTAYRTYVGGVVGFNGEGGHTFKNISSNIKVIGSTCDIGGIFGIAHYNNKFENITFTGSVEAPEGAEEVGGIAGVWHNQVGTSVTFTDCTSTGTVTIGTETTTGSIVGGAYNVANETEENSGSLIINGKESWLKVAEVNGVKYLTLQEAINNSTENATITLLSNVEQEDGVIVTDKKLTIDLNQKTFTVTNGASTNNRNFKINGASVVTIKNGTMVAAGDYSSGAYGTVRTEGTANVTLTGLKLYNYRGNGLNIKALSGTTVAIDNTEIYSQYGGGIEAAGGTITLAETVKVEQKGMYTAPYNSMAISVNGGGKVTVNGGTYSTECITATEANNQGTSHGPWVVGVLNSGGTLIINGGTFSNDNYGDNSLATAARGAVLADTKAKVEIYGGTFNALKAIIDIQNNLGDANNNPSVLLAGGTYNADPRNSAQYGSNLITLAEGYDVKNTTNGTWVVKQTSGELTRTLPQGWSWFSSYVKLSGADGFTTLTRELGTAGVQIKDEAGRKFAQYSVASNSWYGELKEASSTKMYSIKTSAAVEVNLAGEFYGVENYEPILRDGWNYLSYPHTETLEIALALQGFKPVEGDIIKSKSASAIYLDGSWYNAIELNPGEGYMYRNQDGNKQVSYTTEATRSAAKAYVSEAPKYWSVDATQYSSNMTMIATMDVDGADYEVAAFVNGELRGSARPIYVEAFDQYLVLMTINGDEVANVTFKYYDINAGEEYDFNNVVVYSNDAILGSATEPYALTRGTTGIGEATLSDINIYPNPTTTDREINLQATCDKVEVFNTLGVKVAEYQNVDSIDALETAGTYVIRVTLNGDVKHCRLVVK